MSMKLLVEKLNRSGKHARIIENKTSKILAEAKRMGLDPNSLVKTRTLSENTDKYAYITKDGLVHTFTHADDYNSPFSSNLYEDSDYKPESNLYKENIDHKYKGSFPNSTPPQLEDISVGQFFVADVRTREVYLKINDMGSNNVINCSTGKIISLNKYMSVMPVDASFTPAKF